VFDIYAGQFLGAADLYTRLQRLSALFQYESYSKRIIPEVLNFFAAAFMILGPTSMKISPIPGSFPLGDMQESAGKERLSGLKLRSKLAAKCVVRKADLPSLLELGSEDASLEEQEVEQHKVDMLALNIRLIRSAAEMYSEAEAYPEIFQPLLELMKSLEASKIPKELKVSRNSQIIPRDIASSQLPN
jgi:nucleolar protein 14